MDAREMIVAVYPSKPIIIQLGENRIRITLPRNTKDIESVALSEIANQCHRLIPEEKSSLIAFGFNYDVSVTTTSGSPHKMLKDLFTSDIDEINTKINGQLLGVVPRLIFARKEARYDLILEAVDDNRIDNRIKAHLNVHFERGDMPFPPKDELELAFKEEYNYFATMLSQLFEGGC
jgi:hypothetical protein